MRRPSIFTTVSIAATCAAAFGLAGCGGDETTEVCSLTECGGACVDVANDPLNCGACDKACSTDQFCSSGTCTPIEACTSDQIECNGTCTNIDYDPANCGACDEPCGSGDACVAGMCVRIGCPPLQIECADRCVDPDTDNAFCGASGDCLGANAGAACAPGNVCDGLGICALSCQVGLIDCSGSCIDPDTSPSFCGATSECTGGNAGVACATGDACIEGVCTPPAGTLYFSQDNSGALFTISLGSGRAQYLGVSGSAAGTCGLAFDPNASILYGSQPFGLTHVALDGTSAVTYGIVGMEALAYDPEGDVLYAGINGSFFTVDKTTGVAGATLAAPGFDAEGLAFRASPPTVFAIGGSSPDLHAYDVETNTWSVVGAHGLAVDNGGLDYDPYRDVLYALADGTARNLYAINPATGEATLIGATGLAGIASGGLAFAPGVLP